MILKPSEALQALLDGKNIRRNWWKDVEYIYYDKKNHDIKFNNGKSACIDIREFINRNSEFSIEPADQWEVYEGNKWERIVTIEGEFCTCPKCAHVLPIENRIDFIYCPFCGTKNIER